MSRSVSHGPVSTVFCKDDFLKGVAHLERLGSLGILVDGSSQRM